MFHNVVWFVSDCKGKHNFYISKKNLTFIENLCFRSLKISCTSKNSDREKENKNPRPSKNYGCTLFCKNSRPAKNFGTVWKSLSKNFGASVGKPSGVVQVFRTSERIAQESRRGCRNTRSPKESRRATNKQIFALYIGIEKYLQKKLRKIWKYRNLL